MNTVSHDQLLTISLNDAAMEDGTIGAGLVHRFHDFVERRRYVDVADAAGVATLCAVDRYSEILSRAGDDLDGRFTLTEIEMLLAYLRLPFETNNTAGLAAALADECGREGYSDIPPHMMALYHKLELLTPAQSCALADTLERLVYVYLLPGKQRSIAHAADAAGLFLLDEIGEEVN